MSRITYIYNPAERFVAGTVGAPGERTFFLQARTGSRMTSVALEKAQVAALAQRVQMLIRDLRRTNPSVALIPTSRDDSPLEQPIFEEFRVGVISLSWDESKSLICIECEAVNDESEVVDNESDLLQVYLTPGAAAAFATRALIVVEAGRTACPFCEIPIDPQGHLCPRANGYRR